MVSGIHHSMGLKGPLRDPNSRRGQAEARQRERLAFIDGRSSTGAASLENAQPVPIEDMPTCPENLPPSVAVKWNEIVRDMAAAGISAKQLDSRAIAIAAGYGVDLDCLESDVSRQKLSVSKQIALTRVKTALRRDYLVALQVIGGTPLARRRMGITQAQKPKQVDDPWSSV